MNNLAKAFEVRAQLQRVPMYRHVGDHDRKVRSRECSTSAGADSVANPFALIAYVEEEDSECCGGAELDHCVGMTSLGQDAVDGSVPQSMPSKEIASLLERASLWQKVVCSG